MIVAVLLQADRLALERPFRAWYVSDVVTLTMKLGELEWRAVEGGLWSDVGRCVDERSDVGASANSSGTDGGATDDVGSDGRVFDLVDMAGRFMEEWGTMSL